VGKSPYSVRQSPLIFANHLPGLSQLGHKRRPPFFGVGCCCYILHGTVSGGSKPMNQIGPWLSTLTSNSCSRSFALRLETSDKHDIHIMMKSNGFSCNLPRLKHNCFVSQVAKIVSGICLPPCLTNLANSSTPFDADLGLSNYDFRSMQTSNHPRSRGRMDSWLRRGFSIWETWRREVSQLPTSVVLAFADLHGSQSAQMRLRTRQPRGRMPRIPLDSITLSRESAMVFVSE